MLRGVADVTLYTPLISQAVAGGAIASTVKTCSELTNHPRTLRAIRRVLQNLMDHPDESKYRQLRLANATVQATLAAHPQALALLASVGFTPLHDTDTDIGSAGGGGDGGGGAAARAQHNGVGGGGATRASGDGEGGGAVCKPAGLLVCAGFLDMEHILKLIEVLDSFIDPAVGSGGGGGGIRAGAGAGAGGDSVGNGGGTASRADNELSERAKGKRRRIGP